MSSLTEMLLTFILISTSAYLIWTILRIRQRRLKHSADSGNEHIGEAKDPQLLMEPTPDALNEMEKLLVKEGLSLSEE
tara:strand:+ start:7284 stop:7517 length:234 start_codon:yes stop_codon:yes gene_type:complete